MGTSFDNDLAESISSIRAASSLVPELAIVLGSGMADIADLMQDKVSIAYADIPNFPRTTSPSHRGQLHIGKLDGVSCAIMQGRVHLYEGYRPEEVVYPVRLLRSLGATNLFVTNAAGGVNPNYAVGDLVLVEDHINIAGMAGMDPTRGANIETLGGRFTPLNGAYDPAFVDCLESAASDLQIKTHRGVYGFACGPSFETPAEIRFLNLIGADAVGMSTVPEVIAARHSGMRVAAVSAITNVAIHETRSQSQTTEEEVYENAPLMLDNIGRLLRAFIASSPVAKN